jgi:hypothetical protein
MPNVIIKPSNKITLDQLGERMECQVIATQLGSGEWVATFSTEVSYFVVSHRAGGSGALTPRGFSTESAEEALKALAHEVSGKVLDKSTGRLPWNTKAFDLTTTKVVVK